MFQHGTTFLTERVGSLPCPFTKGRVFYLLGRLLELGTASSQVIIKSPLFFWSPTESQDLFPEEAPISDAATRSQIGNASWEQKGAKGKGVDVERFGYYCSSSLWQRVSTPAVGLLQVLVNNQENYGSIFPPNWTWHQQGFMMICDDCT